MIDIERNRTRSSWKAMMERCRRPDSASFRKYGGSGIDVCARWESFECFVEDMGHRPEGKSIDRIDNSLGYFKENCRWSTTTEQIRNRSISVRATIDGVTKTATEWAKTVGITEASMRKRIHAGQSGDYLLRKGKTPNGHKKRRTCACGRTIDDYATRCRICHVAEVRSRPKLPPNHCCACRVEIHQKAKRCEPCYYAAKKGRPPGSKIDGVS